MSELHIDFETRSTVDLKKAGLDVYAHHPSTDVWCCCWALDDEDVEWWVLGDPAPEPLMELVRSGVRIVAHNAGFEWTIWNTILVPRYGWVPFAFEQMDCTAARAAAMSLPRDLRRAAIAMGLSERKDDKGKRLMLQMAKPRRIEPDNTVVWWECAAKFDILLEYCKQDVRTERALSKQLQPLSDFERRVWLLDHRINQRGVRIDKRSVRTARRMVVEALDTLNGDLARVTQQQVKTLKNNGSLTSWLAGQGVVMASLDKAAVADALRLDMPDAARDALLIRQEGNKSSTAKLDAMLARLGPDGRTRETLMYHAAGTGRWGGKGIQLQNLPRPTMEPADVLLAFEALATRDVKYLELFGSVPSVVASMLRGMVIASDGHELVRGDYSNIEGRVLAWLADEAWKLQAFRDFDAKVGPDLYLLSAAGIYGVPVSSLNKDSPERQIGKVAELALGFGGGVGAFQTMAANYGVVVSDEDADAIKEAWRAKHPATVDMWAALDWAARMAVKHPGKVYDYGMAGWGDDKRRVELKVSYGVAGTVLWCKLPSGRLLAYPSPRVAMEPTPWGQDRATVTYMCMNTQNQWVRKKGYGGLWAENITQAVARDIMAQAMLRIDETRGWPVVLTVHDEVVSEVPTGTVSVAEYEAEMNILPSWATGLPVTSKGDVGERYGK